MVSFGECSFAPSGLGLSAVFPRAWALGFILVPLGGFSCFANLTSGAEAPVSCGLYAALKRRSTVSGLARGCRATARVSGLRGRALRGDLTRALSPQIPGRFRLGSGLSRAPGGAGVPPLHSCFALRSNCYGRDDNFLCSLHHWLLYALGTGLVEEGSNCSTFTLAMR